MMNKTTVILVNTALGWSRGFAPDHAERLLSLRNNGGWELPKDSPYTYTKENGLAVKRNKADKQKGA